MSNANFSIDFHSESFINGLIRNLDVELPANESPEAQSSRMIVRKMFDAAVLHYAKENGLIL